MQQYLIAHRKHVKRRLVNCNGSKRLYSSGKYLKLGDLYARLGLTADASNAEIKKAYYDLSKEHHPDRNEGCSIATAKFRSVSEAYEILGNVTSRAQYDRGNGDISFIVFWLIILDFIQLKPKLLIFILLFIQNQKKIFRFAIETPYGRVQRRPRYKQPQQSESSSSFSEKDEDLAEKIRSYRANMRKNARRPREDEEFTFRRENVFDFDAWYRAHFNDDFDTKLRDERIKQYAEQYKEQKQRILRGDMFRIRPPRPYLERKEPSDIENQMEEMTQKEIRREIKNTLLLGIIVIVSISIALAIMDKENVSGPYEDLYAKKQNSSILPAKAD